MSWSYDETLPTTKDVMRACLSDTTAIAPLHSDEHIAAALSRFASTSRPFDNAFIMLAGEILDAHAERPKSYAESGGISVSWDRIGPLQKRLERVIDGSLTYERSALVTASSWGAPVSYTTDALEPIPEFAS